MDKLYAETKTSLVQINDLLIKFDTAPPQEPAEQALKFQITEKLDHIGKCCEQLEFYVNKEPASRRFDVKLKVDQLKYDFNHYKAAFGSIQFKKDQREAEKRRRDELINSTSFHNSNQGHVQLNLDNEQGELRHFNRVNRANDELDRMIDHGENVLQGIRIQNDTIKAIKRKIFNVTNTLGLSNTLIRMIDRRQTSDKYILFGGMIITCLIMVLVIYYFL